MPGPGTSGLTDDEKEVFVNTLDILGDEGVGLKLKTELKKLFDSGTLEAKKGWLAKYNTPAITPAEDKKFADILKDITDAKEKKESEELWKTGANATKRYFLRLYEEAEEVRAPSPATLIVNLPADASLTIGGQATVSTTSRRQFSSPTLPTGGTYSYTLRATYVRDGVSVVVTREATVRAGRTTEVSLEPFPAVASR
jgi:uncharacterized protein (TIGR03000 family)